MRQRSFSTNSDIDEGHTAAALYGEIRVIDASEYCGFTTRYYTYGNTRGGVKRILKSNAAKVEVSLEKQETSYTSKVYVQKNGIIPYM